MHVVFVKIGFFVYFAFSLFKSYVFELTSEKRLNSSYNTSFRFVLASNCENDQHCFAIVQSSTVPELGGRETL